MFLNTHNRKFGVDSDPDRPRSERFGSGPTERSDRAQVAGALKVPLSKAPVGRVPADGELVLVDGRFSAVATAPKAEKHKAPPRKQLGSVRVRVACRMGGASRVRAALAPRGALAQSIDAGEPVASSSRPASADTVAGRLASAGNRYYRDPEALGEALPPGSAGGKRPPTRLRLRKERTAADILKPRAGEENPWGLAEALAAAPSPAAAAASTTARAAAAAASRIREQRDALNDDFDAMEASLAEAPASSERNRKAFPRPPSSRVEEAVLEETRGEVTVVEMPEEPGDAFLFKDVDEPGVWSLNDPKAADAGPSGATLEALLRRGEALAARAARAAEDGGSDDAAGVAAFLDDELAAATASCTPPDPAPSNKVGAAAPAADSAAGGVGSDDLCGIPPPGGPLAEPASAPLLALQRRAAALASDLDADAEVLAHADDDLVDELLRDPELRAATDLLDRRQQETRLEAEAPPPPSRDPVAPPPPPPVSFPEPPARGLRCLLRVRSARLDRATAAASSAARVAHHWALPRAPDRARRRRDGRFGSDFVAGAETPRGSSSVRPRRDGHQEDARQFGLCAVLLRGGRLGKRRRRSNDRDRRARRRYAVAYDCAAPFSGVDDAAALSRCTQIVEVWARSYDGTAGPPRGARPFETN